jgi:hypothetical protein
MMTRRNKNLNAAARDILQLLSFDPNSREATSLLRAVQYEHGRLGGGMGCSQILQSLDCLRSSVFNGDSGGARNAPCDAAYENFMGGSGVGGGIDALPCLCTLQAPLTKEISLSAKDIGWRGGVPLMLQIAKHGIIVLPTKYTGKDSLPPRLLAQFAEEVVALSSNDNGSRRNRLAVVIVAVLGLLVWLIVHWKLCELVQFFVPKILEDESVDEGNAINKTTNS